MSLGGICGDTDNISSVAGQLGLDVGELLHHLATLPVTAVEDNDQISERKQDFIFNFWATFLPLLPTFLCIEIF